MGESIGDREESSGDMDHFEIEIYKVKKPVSLVIVQILGLTEVGQVFVIHKHLNGKRRTLEVMAPGSETSDDSKKLPVIYVIVSFCREE